MTVQALRPLYELKTRLGDIQTANGYHTDAGSRVFLGRVLADGSDVPAVSVMPAEDAEGEVTVDAELYRERVPYEIHGVANADPSHPLKAGHQLGADIRRAIYRARSADFELLGGTAVQVEPGPTVVTQRDPGSSYSDVVVSLTITHAERFGDPDRD
jgi:hypothetical protein